MSSGRPVAPVAPAPAPAPSAAPASAPHSRQANNHNRYRNGNGNGNCNNQNRSSQFVPKIPEIETLATSSENKGQDFAKFHKSIHHQVLTTFRNSKDMSDAILKFTDQSRSTNLRTIQKASAQHLCTHHLCPLQQIGTLCNRMPFPYCWASTVFSASKAGHSVEPVSDHVVSHSR